MEPVGTLEVTGTWTWTTQNGKTEQDATATRKWSQR